MNSLYYTAMLHPMPLSDFQWISGDEAYKVLHDLSYNWLELDTWYWLEVDIECPKKFTTVWQHIPCSPIKSMAN
jgi:hypothetical protein